MNVNQLHEQYWFSEGQIKSFHLDIQNNRVDVEFLIIYTRYKLIEDDCLHEDKAL